MIYEEKKDQIETIKEGVIKMYKRGGKPHKRQVIFGPDGLK